MSRGYVTLRNFSESELIFDEAETKEILKFFFVNIRPSIDQATMTTAFRNFTQGLLVEAVDATYALSYIEIVFKTFSKPPTNIMKLLTKLGRKASRHWLKHATQDNLMSADISLIVRDRLALSFAIIINGLLTDALSSARMHRMNIAYVDYGRG